MSFFRVLNPVFGCFFPTPYTYEESTDVYLSKKEDSMAESMSKAAKIGLG